MKKIAHYLLLGTASLVAAYAQTNTSVTNAPADWTNTTAVVSTSTNEVPTIATTATNAPAVETNAAPVVAAEPAGTNAPAVVVASSIPLIQFSDVPITTAIENLARQAGINYMLDPKIGYGVADAQGQVKAEPQLSIRWENISAENALLALLDNYNLQLTHDKKTGIDRVTLKDPLAPPPLITRVIQLQYASVSNMVEAVQSALTDPKRSRVIADNRTSQMVVVATDPEQTAVDILIKQLDKPTRQVEIEAKLVEITSQPSTKKGVDWSSTLSAQRVTFGNGNTTGSKKTTITSPGDTVSTPGGGHTGAEGESTTKVLNIVQSLGGGGFSASTLAGLVPYTAFLNADGVSATLSFLNANYNAKIMSTPRVVTLDNETAKIEVTRQFPILSVGGSTQNSAGSSSVTYSNIGTILQVTPRISASDKIRLTVFPEVSSHFGDQTVSVPGNGGANFSFTVPIFDSRRLTTQVLIPSGNTLVMGGMIRDNPTSSSTKVPMLGDIPGIGWAFRSEVKSMEKDNLIIFITPTIVKDDDFTQHESNFLKQGPAPFKQSMNPNTWWDGGDRRGNWDNPAPVSGEFDYQDKLHNF